MQELVLHKAGELTKFGNVAAKKIDTMHHSQDATYCAFLAQNRFEDRPRSARILICPGHVAEASAQKVLQLRANIHLVLLRQLKRAHHLLGVIAKNIATRRVQLFVSDKKKPTKRGLFGSCQGKETEKGARLARDVSAHKLLGNPLDYSQDVSRVTVVVPHKRFIPELAFASGIAQPAGDLFLQIKMKYVCGAPGRVMQVCAQAQKKIVCSLDPALIAFA